MSHRHKPEEKSPDGSFTELALKEVPYGQSMIRKFFKYRLENMEQILGSEVMLFGVPKLGIFVTKPAEGILHISRRFMLNCSMMF